MAHQNKVLRSINAPGEARCVDIFRRPDGSFGFEEYRRDMEDGSGWFAIGFHAERRFPDETAAFAAARQSVAWLEEVPMPERRAPYVVVDVFTATRFGGNQLAVITDARGIADDEMQRIAAEFNFAETTFVLPPDRPGDTARVRIFTRMQEVPFAGHPNVGTAYVLARQGDVFGKMSGAAMRFDELAGPVEVSVLRDAGEVTGATIAAPRGVETWGPVDPALIAHCIGLDPGEIILANHPPTPASVGLRFTLVEVTSEALSRARADLGAFRNAAGSGLSDATGRFSIYAYARPGDGTDRLRARMFAPLSGNFEDPATGSAAAALGGFLAELDPGPDGRRRIAIAQGVEMGRPSEIILDIAKEEGRASAVHITGRCVETMRGTLSLG